MSTKAKRVKADLILTLLKDNKITHEDAVVLLSGKGKPKPPPDPPG